MGTRHTAWAAVALVLALTASACGDSGDENGTTTAPPVPRETTTTTLDPTEYAVPKDVVDAEGANPLAGFPEPVVCVEDDATRTGIEEWEEIDPGPLIEANLLDFEAVHVAFRVPPREVGPAHLLVFSAALEAVARAAAEEVRICAESLLAEGGAPVPAETVQVDLLVTQALAAAIEVDVGAFFVERQNMIDAGEPDITLAKIAANLSGLSEDEIREAIDAAGLPVEIVDEVDALALVPVGGVPGQTLEDDLAAGGVVYTVTADQEHEAFRGLENGWVTRVDADPSLGSWRGANWRSGCTTYQSVRSKATAGSHSLKLYRGSNRSGNYLTGTSARHPTKPKSGLIGKSVSPKVRFTARVAAGSQGTTYSITTSGWSSGTGYVC